MPNYEYYRACKEALKTPAKPSDDELMFEDCPKAVNELEYVYSECAMADSIVDTKK